jgi:hypothetical protein
MPRRPVVAVKGFVKADPSINPVSTDHQFFVNQHVFGTSAAHAPMFCLRESQNGDMAAAYLISFDVMRAGATNYYEGA